jgi:type VI secretion system protein ImpM
MNERLSTVSAMKVGFVGKIPARGDFIRQHIGERVSTELEQWLQKSTQSLFQAKAELPSQNVRFLYTTAGCDSAALGVLKKSSDQVGRSFPLAIFTTVPLTEAMSKLSSLPAIYGPFLSATDAVLDSAAGATVESLRDAVNALLLPAHDESLAAAERTTRALRETDALALLRLLFGVEPADGLYYGLYTFLSATAAVRSGPPPSAATVLDCPSMVDPALAAWLELARQRLAWRQFCPSLIWSEGQGARLLLALGAASDQLLQFFVDPGHQSARLWPLWSQRTDAIARARTALNQVANALSSPTSPLSVEALWSMVMQVTI